MYLSKLEIIGFKSFAQKVGLSFDSGISAIVGPNGCGKTNIVDAIRWVLGEQRYSALRSERMEDVIFNGTKSRKPLGMAEVSLVIENTKGILPSEYSQVTIGRRVYRSGESEYLLNKSLCRLKDILDLFMDTGMGADAYSVIELKMVETILSDKTDERRRLFEEAAGVTKYKHRRKAAYRKLESVQADLLRVNDIISEIQKAVQSLERQARKAGQFNEVKSRLEKLEIDLMEREYAQLFSRIRPLEARLNSLTDDKNKIDAGLSEEEHRLDALRATMNEVDKRVADAQRDFGLQLEKIRLVEQRNLVAAERVKALQDNIHRYETEKAELRLELGELDVLKVALQQRIEELSSQEAGATAELRERETGLQEFGVFLEARRSELQSLNDQTIGLVHAIAEKQTAQDRTRGRVENLNGRSARAAEEIAMYENEILNLEKQITELSAEDKRLRRLFTEVEMKYYDAESEKKELEKRVEGLQRKEMETRGEIDRVSAKLEFLKGLIESRDGLSESVRFLSSTDSWKPSRKMTVADGIHAEERFRTAIEAALGEHSGLMVVDSAKDAELAIALLKESDRGKATFVCIDRLPRISSVRRLPRIMGVYGWAADLARYDQACEPLFRLLLDNTLVVDNMETAAKVVARVSGIRCVTLGGEIATTVGILQGGSKRADEGGMIGKREQIEQFQKTIADLTHQLELQSIALKEATDARDAVQLKPRMDAVKGIEREMNAVEMRLAQLQFEKRRAGDVIAKNREEIEGLSAESQELLHALEESTPELQALKDEKNAVEQRQGAVSLELAALENEWNQRSKLCNDLGIRIATLKGEHQNAESDLKRADETVANILVSLDRRGKDVFRAREDASVASVEMEENGRIMADLQRELQVLETRRGSEEEEIARVRDEIHQRELRIKDERRLHDDSLNAVHELELKIADLRAKAEHIQARAREEFEVTIELKQYPDGEFVDFAALRDEIQSLKEKIKTLGNINFAAFEEYNTEKERYDFLAAQRKDLLEAEKTLLATIEEINATAQKRFLDTFALIRSNFIQTFKSLFDPGDECDLKLEDGVDPLEARIEIIAKPRGKRPTSIDLLSGGEKTLTATALLFAIYLVKPSPFCILDEVDAPLDDANIDRFTRILYKFSDNTQFIVVTHNKRTMESARALYGVTMEEEGVSKLVAVRFNQGSVVQSASLVSG